MSRRCRSISMVLDVKHRVELPTLTQALTAAPLKPGTPLQVDVSAGMLVNFLL